MASHPDTSPARVAAEHLCRPDLQPVWGIVLGSGFGNFAHTIERATSTPFASIPGMPRTSVEGHLGILHLGWLDEIPVAVVQGRLHMYEGHEPTATTFPIRVLAALGVRCLLLTNAAGGINPAYATGSLMLLRDHIDLPALAGANPLRGAWPGLPRFVNMHEAYDPTLRSYLRDAGRRLGIPLHEGVYAMVAGPSFETAAEVRLLRVLGADAVGMSTAHETIVARQLGLRVAAISCISNAAHGADEGNVDHRDVLNVVTEKVPAVLALVRGLLASYA